MDRKSENIFSPKYSHSKRPISQNWFYGILILNILTANTIFYSKIYAFVYNIQNVGKFTRSGAN